jgi:hypothetical protein
MASPIFLLGLGATTTTIVTTPPPPIPAPIIGAFNSMVALCSAAFLQCGLAAITSMEERNPRTAAARLIFQATVDEVIVDHGWKCSLARAALSKLSTNPAWDYPYHFNLPTDPYCLKVWQTSLDRTGGGSLATVDVSGEDAGLSERGRWTVEGRKLLADSDTIKLLYGARLTDPNLFDPGLASALVYKLASKLAFPLTGKAPLAADLRKLYEIELARAKGSDSQQRSPRTAPARTLTDVR